MTTGYTASAHDSRVYGSCPLATMPDEYFGPNQYLLADSAYVPTRTVIPQFKRPYTDRQPYRDYVRRHGCVRIDAEHGFGMLKGRLQSLSGLRVKIETKECYEFACRWIVACCVLHNMWLHNQDTWTENDGWQAEDPAATAASADHAHAMDRIHTTATNARGGNVLRDKIMWRVGRYNWEMSSEAKRQANQKVHEQGHHGVNAREEDV